MNETGGSSIAVQAGILAVATIVVRIIGLLYRSPLTAIIGDEGNGYYGTAINIYTIVLMVSSFGVPAAISKQMAQKMAVGDYKNAQKVFQGPLWKKGCIPREMPLTETSTSLQLPGSPEPLL